MSEKFERMLNDKIDKLKSDYDYNALSHMTLDKDTKLSRLPDFPELSRLKGQHPDILYTKAVMLRADRNELEEKVLIPLRRMLAAWFQYQSVVGDGKSLVEDDDRSLEDMADDAGTDIFAQMFVLAKNLLQYEVDPVTSTVLGNSL